jgi:hypothetical protein
MTRYARQAERAPDVYRSRHIYGLCEPPNPPLRVPVPTHHYTAPLSAPDRIKCLPRVNECQQRDELPPTIGLIGI